MGDAESHNDGAARARWESHYDRWGSRYIEEAEVHRDQDADILDSVVALEPGTALDVGCGVGGLCIDLGRRGWAVTGIDIAPRAIELAQRMAAERRTDARFLTADATVWQPERAYDLVTCNFGLPPQPEGRAAVYAMMRRAVSPGGVVLLKIAETKGMREPPARDGYESLGLEELQGAFDGFEAVKSTIADAAAHGHFSPKGHAQRWKTVLFMARRPRA